MTFSEKDQLSNKCCEQTEVAEPFRQYKAKKNEYIIMDAFKEKTIP